MKIEKTKIPSSKGNLAAAIHYPEKKTERLAILCPGKLDSKDYAHLVGLADNLSKQGYSVVRFEPTGTWESDGNISDYTTTQYIEDIKNIIDYMLRQANFTHILLGGHSRGGQVSILYAARDPIISLVLGIMPSSERTLTAHDYDEWKKTGFRLSYRDLPDDKSRKREFQLPFSHAEDMIRYNVVEDVKRIKVPIILIAGELDNTVLPEYVKEIFDNANEPKKFIIIPGIGHDYRHNDSEIATVNEKILQQLRIYT
jgi:pimeloyl-ACP methyl ester carboxylesterase